MIIIKKIIGVPIIVDIIEIGLIDMPQYTVNGNTIFVSKICNSIRSMQ